MQVIIRQLPPEIWAHILHFLKGERELLKLRLVSKTWRDLIRDFKMITHIKLNRGVKIADFLTIPRIFPAPLTIEMEPLEE